MTQSDDGKTGSALIELPEKTHFKIGEVAKLLDVEPYVLRYWETEFEVLEPKKTKSGQRVYQRNDIELLMQIRSLLYEEMFTIAGARRQLARSREGKPSYFDLTENAPRAQGTAVAGNEELRRQLESARRELATAQTELNQAEEALQQARGDAEKIDGVADQLRQELKVAQVQLEERESQESDGEAVAELQSEIENLERRLSKAQTQAQDQRDQMQRKMRERRSRRRDALGALRQEVESLAAVAHAGAPRTRR